MKYLCRFSEVKADVRKHREERGGRERLEEIESKMRLKFLSEQFIEWNNGHKVQQAVVSLALISTYFHKLYVYMYFNILYINTFFLMY